jgi:hypothetical protein
LFPVLHVISHVCQVDSLFVVHIHDDLFEGFVTSELILGEKDLLEGVGGVKPIDDLRVGEFGFKF